MRTKYLDDFLRDSVDDQRKKEMSSLSDKYTKEEFFKAYQKIKVIKKSRFNKTYLVRYNNKNFILRKFLLPSLDQSQALAQQYHDAHLRLPECEQISKVISIFQCKTKTGLISWMGWGSNNQKKNKSEPYKIFGYQVYTKKLYALEEYFGKTLREEIAKRRQENNHFQLDEILSIFSQIVYGVMAFHKMNYQHRQLKLSNILINQDLQIKITGFLEPVNSFKEKLLLETIIDEDRDISFVPTEKIISFGIFLQCIGNFITNGFGQTNKFDAWSLGICLLRICTLCSSIQIQDIHNSTQKINNFIQEIKEQYGEGVSSIVSKLVVSQPSARSEIKDIVSLVHSSSLVPIFLKCEKEIQSKCEQNKKFISQLDEEVVLNLNSEFNQMINYTNQNQQFHIKMAFQGQQINEVLLIQVLDSIANFCQVEKFELNLAQYLVPVE